MTITLARSSDPDTSHMAVEPQPLSELRRIVLDIFRERDADELGMTDSELDDFYAAHYDKRGWPAVRYETPRKRRSDLANMDLLVDSSFRRRNRFGRLEAVWVLA